MLIAARVAGTRHVSGAGIHTEFQPFRMNVIGNGFHTMRKFFRIRHKTAVFIAFT